ncbi:BRISC and BRCA1-A complex member 2-like [Onthophagus taurus]|uniref:BRISC and BRCA1-A complex member 2-like n=1 Tax=Onthophagus taurus TaxID=166361 RepID=UPI0039BDC539
MSQLTLDEMLIRYPECIRSNLKELVTNGIGLTKSLIQMKLPFHKLLDNYDINCDNSIILDLPYAERYLSVEIIFVDEDLTFPPDFDILNDTFLDDPDVDLIEKHLPSLTDWSLQNPKSLLNFIIQLRDLYKKHQIEKFLQGPKYSFQPDDYNLLKSQCKLNDNDMELLIENGTQHILIPLNLDFTTFPKYIYKKCFDDENLENPGKDQSILKINFGYRTSVSLQLSPLIDRFFSNFAPLDVPKYNRTKTLPEYFELVQTTLVDKIKEIETIFKKKENYISLLLSALGDNIIEYDSISFTEATFFFEVDSFACFVKFRFSDNFPTTKPSITFRSIYHQISGIPITFMLLSYPYNPGWDVKQMVNKILIKIQENIPQFKTYCLNKML